jgi:hypothetical protein
VSEIPKHALYFASRDDMESFEVFGRVTVRMALRRRYDERPLGEQKADAINTLRRDIAVLLRCQPVDIDMMGAAETTGR